MNEIDVLIKARKLIEKPENWTTRFLCRRPDGSGHNGTITLDAVCFCMNGAIMRATGKRSANDLFHRAVAALEKGAGLGSEASSQFNDRSTHAGVLAAFDRAISALSHSVDGSAK